MEAMNVMLDHQKTARTVKMWLSSALIWLTALSWGVIQAYLAVGLPQLLEKNATGIILDMNKLSLISKYGNFWRYDRRDKRGSKIFFVGSVPL